MGMNANSGLFPIVSEYCERQNDPSSLGKSAVVVNKMNVDSSNAKPNNGSGDCTNASAEKSGSGWTGNTKETESYAKFFKGESSGKRANFRKLLAPAGNGVELFLWIRSVLFMNRLNTWSKFGLIKAMMNSNGVFFFKFNSKDGTMDAMLENGPWLIRNMPLILKKWSPDANIMKEDVCNVPVWVKLHDSPIATFTEAGLSAITTKLGTPLMLDSYTSTMCMESWGRSSYARAMIELRVDAELKHSLVVAVPKFEGEEYTIWVVKNIICDPHFLIRELFSCFISNMKNAFNTPAKAINFCKLHVIVFESRLLEVRILGSLESCWIEFNWWFVLSEGEMKKLLSLINETPFRIIHSNMTGWIIDFGANQYLTVSTVAMFNIVDISSIKITVRQLNGTLATIGHVGNLILSNNVILYDVLVVHGYCVSLLSVKKLIRIAKYVLVLMRIGHSADQVLSVLKHDLNISNNSFVPVSKGS
uniref:DUF4283 domain-containing protein n=1 Tax=Tanacetum cinerariifolium TaxID=118510 RepID=A0A699H5S2_TANCI|nr:hypothetical protein [Tanacetum cinerariifolium]